MTDTTEVYWYGKIFRWLFAMIDKIVYELISFVTDIFNVIAGTEIRTSGVLNDFFNRIQIILGIIILFKLVISFFSGIVNPEGFKDQKKGFGSVIKRVVVVLVMLFLIVPLNIPEQDVENLENAKENNQKTWNARMNESGILFGTLSELQSRIIRGNVIPKIILGNNQLGENDDDIALIVLKSFIFVNLQPGASESDDAAIDESNWLCPTNNYENSAAEDEEAATAIKILNNEPVDFVIRDYTEKNSDGKNVIRTIFNFIVPITALLPEKQNAADYEVTEKHITDRKSVLELKRNTLLNSINYKCDLNHPKGTILDGSDGERYIFIYKFFLSTVAGILCLVLLLSLTIDVAVRVFKLLVLRIISPIAILSYIDPKSEKTFNNWVKALASTYLDLFIRIAIISFTIVLVKMVPDLLTWNTYSGDNVSFFVKLFSRVVLIFGLFFFAKEAPKFITQTLGIENKNGGGIFSGFGKLIAGTSIGLGTIGSFRAGRMASIEADRANGINPGHWWTRFGNHGKHIMSGITGTIGGVATGTNAMLNAKDHYVRNTTQAMNQRNTNILSNARSGGTAFGAFASDVGTFVNGESDYNRMEAQWKAQEQQISNEELALKTRQDSIKARQSNLTSRREMNKHRKDIMDEVTSKTVDSLQTRGSYGRIRDANYYKFKAFVDSVRTNGVGISTLADGTKVVTYENQTIPLSELAMYENEIRKANEANYYEQVLNGNITNDRITNAIRYGNITETRYSGNGGLKAAFGAEDGDILHQTDILNAESEALNNAYQVLSDRRQQINNQKQSVMAQRAQSNANRHKRNN